jgi:exodeoxyribonuclease III
MYFNSSAGGGFHVWRQRFSRVGDFSGPEQITSGPAEEEGIAIAPDGRALITAVAMKQGSVWVDERSWNGVAILARECDPVLTRSSLPGNPDDHQARYIEAAVNGVLITSIDLPNGNPQPGPKFDYKLAWFERLVEHGAELMKAGVPVVLAGDYNVVPTVQDIDPTRSLDKNALIQPQSRQAYARLLAQGWTDALRKLQPEGPLWTFWDYERNRWPLDKGMRLDHFLLSPPACDRLVHGGVDRWVRGDENASDHAPAWIVLGH